MSSAFAAAADRCDGLRKLASRLTDAGEPSAQAPQVFQSNALVLTGRHELAISALNDALSTVSPPSDANIVLPAHSPVLLTLCMNWFHRRRSVLCSTTCRPSAPLS
jgi:hypothetical protein